MRTAYQLHNGEGRVGGLEGQGLWVWHKCIYSLGLVGIARVLASLQLGYLVVKEHRNRIALPGNLSFIPCLSRCMPTNYSHLLPPPLCPPPLHRKDAKSVKVKKSSTGTKFKIRCSRVRTLTSMRVCISVLAFVYVYPFIGGI